MNNDSLAPYDWGVSPALENPVTSPKTTWEFPIGENCMILVTNQFMSQRMDSWMIWEKVSEELASIGSLNLRFVDNAFTKTEALQKAREYAWTTYHFDISVYDIPF